MLTGELLNRVSLASDEESLGRTPAQSFSDPVEEHVSPHSPTGPHSPHSPTSKKISAPTSFPSNFSTIR